MHNLQNMTLPLQFALWVKETCYCLVPTGNNSKPSYFWSKCCQRFKIRYQNTTGSMLVEKGQMLGREGGHRQGDSITHRKTRQKGSWLAGVQQCSRLSHLDRICRSNQHRGPEKLQERERQRYAGQADRLLFITQASQHMGMRDNGEKRGREDRKVKKEMKAGDFPTVHSIFQYVLLLQLNQGRGQTLNK